MAEKLKFDVGGADSIAEALNSSGWIEDPVEAACMIRQGHSPSLAGAAIGVGLLKLWSKKGAKELPRTFVLGATRDRVFAFDAGGTSEEDSDRYTLTIKPGEVGAWPRDQVAMAPAKKGINPNATLSLAGTEVDCTVPDGQANEAFSGLLAALGGGPPATP